MRAKIFVPEVPALKTKLERVMGIEPTSSAWKAEVLPLNYTRLNAFFRRIKILTVIFQQPSGFP